MLSIEIFDCGTNTLCCADGTTLTVEYSGGCPAEDIISASALMAGSAQDIAEAILAEWCAGYDGDPAANGLTVVVEDDSEVGDKRHGWTKA